MAIVLILLSIFGKYFNHAREVYCFGIGFTMIAAVLDLFRVSGINAVSGIVASAEGWLPLYSMGLGWVTPSVLGVIIGLCVYIAHRKKAGA